MGKKPTVIDLRGFLSFQILCELGRKRLCGDDLAGIIGKRKAAKLTPGTIYPALKTLRRHKLIALTQHGRKKVYRLTSRGKKELHTARQIFRRSFHSLLSR